MRITDSNDLPPPNDRTMFSLSTSEAAQVPTKINPIRFAILYRNGRTSNVWGVKVQNTGDGYIYWRRIHLLPRQHEWTKGQSSRFREAAHLD